MLLFFKKLYGKAGLDSSILYTVLTKVVQSVGGILTLLIITRLLNKNEQGYYYTFWSILSIQVFFELGLTTITTQYIAHEAAHLSWKNKSELSGDEYYRSRLASIVRLSVKWFLILAVVLFFVLLFAGRYFFLTYNAGLDVNWQLPWLFLSASTCFIH
jgi:O-antigen/teichoic acid export membrane protein